jgi:L-rhamnose-H+ transport protein
VGWAVLMASSIMFSGALGLILGEWKGTSIRTRSLLGLGLAVLLGSAVLSGYSGALGQKAATAAPAPAAAAGTN